MDDRWYKLIRNVVYFVGGIYALLLIVMLLNGFLSALS